MKKITFDDLYKKSTEQIKNDSSDYDIVREEVHNFLDKNIPKEEYKKTSQRQFEITVDVKDFDNLKVIIYKYKRPQMTGFNFDNNYNLIEKTETYNYICSIALVEYIGTHKRTIDNILSKKSKNKSEIDRHYEKLNKLINNKTINQLFNLFYN